MSTDGFPGGRSQGEHTARIQVGLRELADAVPVPDIGPAELRAAAARRRVRPRPARRGLAVLAAAAAVLAVAAVGLLPAVLPGRDARPGAAPAAAVLPKTFADHSYLTAHVSAAPPGPVVALYSYEQGDFPTQTPQVLVVGVDGRGYREVDAAAGRGTLLSATSPSTLLSPDGTKVAVADSLDDITVVDLVTGETRRYPVGTGTRRFLAWSPESRRLLFLALPQPLGVFDEPRGGEPVLLDLASGALTTIPGQRGTVDAAFAPDGSRLALQRYGELRIVRLDGTVERTVPVPARHRLAGAAAWSPDGTRLALYRMGETGVPGTPAPVYGVPGTGLPDGLAVVDVAGGDTTAVAGAPDDLRALLGWRGDRLLVDRADTIVQVPVGGGPGEVLSRLQPGNDHFIADLQLATGLLPTVEVREAGVDRGPWPTWLRLATAAGTVLVGWLTLRLIRARRRHSA